jgi:hypothetical protein
MKTKLSLLVWLFVPVAALAWHYGPGRSVLERDLAGDSLRLASHAGAADNWAAAADAYRAAGERLPDEDLHDRRRIALAEAVAQVRSGALIDGQEQMESLVSDLERDPAADARLLASARSELATTSYYAAWMMRLEGATPEEWKPEAERARQQFRLLAEQQGAAPDAQQTAAKNLEAVIRLEQMSLEDLLARPLPKNCCSNCKNLCQKKRQQCASRCRGGNKEGKQKQAAQQEDNTRKEIKHSNSAGVFSGDMEGS